MECGVKNKTIPLTEMEIDYNGFGALILFSARQSLQRILFTSCRDRVCPVPTRLIFINLYLPIDKITAKEAATFKRTKPLYIRTKFV